MSYRCDQCGEINTEGWTGKERDEESKRLFPDSHKNKEPMALVCDDCFKKMYRKFS